jgi:hypothetical protein
MASEFFSSGQSATHQTFIQYFQTQGIRVVFLKQVEQHIVINKTLTLAYHLSVWLQIQIHYSKNIVLNTRWLNRNLLFEHYKAFFNHYFEINDETLKSFVTFGEFLNLLVREFGLLDPCSQFQYLIRNPNDDDNEQQQQQKSQQQQPKFRTCKREEVLFQAVKFA